MGGVTPCWSNPMEGLAVELWYVSLFGAVRDSMDLVGLGSGGPQRLPSHYTVPYDQVRTVESTLVMEDQICDLKTNDRNLNKAK